MDAISKTKHISDICRDALYHLEQKMKEPEIQEFLTGISLFDRSGGIFQKGKVVLLGGYPAMGKIGLAISLAETIAKYFEQENISHPDHKKCVLYFSLEDYSVNIVRRLISKNAGISRYYISRGYITDEDFNKIESETIHLEKLPFYINSRLMRIEDIFDEIENRFQNHDEKPAFIIIDYLQLLSQKRQKQMSGPELIQMIKSFSYEYDIPILVLTNLNPQPETRQDKRPRLTDFSELGESPYVDTVIGVYREYDDLFYEAMTPQKKKTEIDKECEKIKHDMDIFIYESQKSFLQEKVCFDEDSGCVNVKKSRGVFI